MIGTKIYPKRSRVIFFLLMYGILSAAGVIMFVISVRNNQAPSNAAGFMIVFGAGMFILTLIKGRKPQVLVHQDFIELRQTRKPQLVRYRNIISIAQPDKVKLVVRLWEDSERKEIPIWIKELDPQDVALLAEFLESRGRRSRDK